MKKIKCLVTALSIMASIAKADDCSNVYQVEAWSDAKASQQAAIGGFATFFVGIVLTGGPALYYKLRSNSRNKAAALLREGKLGVAGPIINERVAEVVKANPDIDAKVLRSRYVEMIELGNDGTLCPPDIFYSTDEMLDWAESVILRHK